MIIDSRMIESLLSLNNEATSQYLAMPKGIKCQKKKVLEKIVIESCWCILNLCTMGDSFNEILIGKGILGLISQTIKLGP